MSIKPYVVVQGDYLTKIAHRFGVNPDDIWGHAKNADLKKLRKSPNVLCPGDLLFVPVPEQPSGPSLSAESENSYTAAVPKVTVKVVLVDEQGEPLAGKQCHVIGGADDPEVPKTLGGDGSLEIELPVTTREITLVVDDGTENPIVRKVQVGHLDPLDESTGIRDRLRLLGFYPDELGAAGAADLSFMAGPGFARLEEQKMIQAVLAFQASKKLPETGEVDAATRDALEAEFGN